MTKTRMEGQGARASDSDVSGVPPLLGERRETRTGLTHAESLGAELC